MSKGLSGVRADQKHSYRSLEHCANQIRGYLGLAPDKALNVLDLFEHLDAISIKLRDGTVIPFRGGVVSLENSEGYTRYDRQKNVIEILASEQTYCWLEIGHPRGAYFVAHEIGHCVLHTDQLVRLAQMPTDQQAAFHRGQEDHKPFEDTEWQANAFASALLMPAQGLRGLEEKHGELTVALIAKQFGVSEEAATYRLELFRNRRSDLLS